MIERFKEVLAALKPKNTLVVGVSGGLDSMALLELLVASGKKLVVAHFNHQLRGAESDDDEAFVRDEAAKRHLEVRFGRGDVRAEAKGISIEMAARKLRHSFLAQVASEVKGDIVLAHHADDQIELVLMRARRGVEGYGAAGMREISASPSDENVRILRPLLAFRKEELETFVKAHDVPFREDSSNAQTDIERNRVRHKTIPALREMFGPDFESEFLKHIQSMRANDDGWRQAAKGWLKHDFRKLPERLQKEILITQLEGMDVRCSRAVLDALLRSNGKPVTIQPGMIVSMSRNGELRKTTK